MGKLDFLQFGWCDEAMFVISGESWFITDYWVEILTLLVMFLHPLRYPWNVHSIQNINPNAWLLFIMKYFGLIVVLGCSSQWRVRMSYVSNSLTMAMPWEFVKAGNCSFLGPISKSFDNTVVNSLSAKNDCFQERKLKIYIYQFINYSFILSKCALVTNHNKV